MLSRFRHSDRRGDLQAERQEEDRVGDEEMPRIEPGVVVLRRQVEDVDIADAAGVTLVVVIR